MRNQPVTIDFDRRRPTSSSLNQGREKEEEERSQLREGERRRGEHGFLPASHDPLPAGDFFSCAGRRNVSPQGEYERGDASVHTPGSGYVLLHHVMGETDGERGVWSYVSTSPFL
ncbi:hypothetical protein B296_00029347 [Ensete ventricosum]|uniref:Uncharacterized protein n=1 Tax=Ensete ventricosum TaxID=4639 RepID=A0A427ALF1_ENSVE|nr:hypothetical protein B296_00029347 [Ensete ventricosum]